MYGSSWGPVALPIRCEDISMSKMLIAVIIKLAPHILTSKHCIGHLVTYTVHTANIKYNKHSEKNNDTELLPIIGEMTSISLLMIDFNKPKWNYINPLHDIRQNDVFFSYIINIII